MLCRTKIKEKEVLIENIISGRGEIGITTAFQAVIEGSSPFARSKLYYMGFLNTKDKKLKVGEEYQYQGERVGDFERKEIHQVMLIEDNSTKDMYKLKIKFEDGEVMALEVGKGDFYFPGMARLWDKDEYAMVAKRPGRRLQPS